jgi:UDP-N-acetyl-2-amino-2-deoxyglucuronate dehydrogenase
MKFSKTRFALIGAAGYIAPKHLSAIADTDSELVAALDPHDSVGVLDRHFPQTRFFTEVERFDRYLEKLRRSEQPVDYVSICSPNYLHDAHVRLAMRVKAHAICEKPLVINPWNLDQLEELEQEHGRRVYTVLQLRRLSAAIELHERVRSDTNSGRRDVCLTYITRRGAWYQSSWKGVEQKSGGLALNIGIHFFDLLGWIFGNAGRSLVHELSSTRAAGCLELEGARVRWLLSIDEEDLPTSTREAGQTAYRSLTIDGEEVDLSAGFTDLHTEVYREILAGNGCGISDARQAIDLVYQVRNTVPTPSAAHAHPLLSQPTQYLRAA